MRSIWIVCVALAALCACGDNNEEPGPERIVVSVDRTDLGVGDTVRVTARYDGEAGGDDIAFASSDPSRASVAGEGGAATVTALAAGDVAITATGRGLTASIDLAIAPASIVRIELAPLQPRVAAGTTAQLAASAVYSDGSRGDITQTAAWTTDRDEIATVVRGLVTGVAQGDATITAQFDGVHASTRCTVTAEIASIAIAPATLTADVGADVPFTATATLTDGTTANATEQVAWSSSDTAVAAISNDAGTRGIADARAAGAATITATLGALTATAQLSTALAPVGPWAPEPGFAPALACVDGVKFASQSDLVYVCTAASGVVKGTVTGTAIAWSTAAVSNPQGQALAAHTTAISTMMYMGAPQAGTDNWFRSNDGAATFTPSLLLDSAGAPRSFYAGRFQPQIGNILASWDPNGGAPQAVLLTGMNPPQNVRVVGAATGTVRAIAGSATNNLYVGVFGETPTGAPATGGVFRSTNSAVTWTAQDTGIAAADKNRVLSLVADAADPLILYAGLAGGGRVYKTVDGGANWAPSASGLPAKARVAQLLISPHSAATLYAATQIGLYRSTDAGATWALAGFAGRAIRGIAQSGLEAGLLLVAVADGVGLYRAI